MSVVRFIFAVLIGLSLAAAPVAAAVAASAASMEHCDKDDMGDCACCDKANACRPDACGATCVKIPGLIAAADLTRNMRARDFAPVEPSMAPLSAWPPPAPPPRT